MNKAIEVNNTDASGKLAEVMYQQKSEASGAPGEEEQTPSGEAAEVRLLMLKL